MMKENRKLNFILYAGILLCFVLMFFFIVPQSDMFLFARDTQPTLQSAALGAYTYGNGRFLGNIIGMYLSHYFVLAFLPLALCLTGMIWLVNRIVFSGSSKTVLPVAILIAFPSAQMVGECYYLYAAFLNYVLPIFLVLLAVLILKTLGEKKRPPAVRIVLIAALFVCTAAAALFSENTTAVLITLCVLWNVSDILNKRTITPHGVSAVLGAGAGAICMLAIPILSESAYKMKHYRGMATGSLPGLVKNILAAFVRFSEIMNTLTLVIAVLSLAFLLLLRNKKKRPLYTFAKAVFAVYPLFSFAVSFADDTSMYMPVVQVIQAVPVLLYAASILIAVSALPDKKSRRRAIGYIVLLLSSVGPMLLVTQYGLRTFYTTFIILLVWALEMLHAQRSALEDILRKYKLRAGQITAALACAFALFSGFLFVQSVINFDFFAVRTAYIAEQIAAGKTETVVPVLPCGMLTVEDDWSNIVRDILPSSHPFEMMQTTDITACENRADYEAIYAGSPIYPFRYAVTHLGYKNPRNLHAQF